MLTDVTGIQPRCRHFGVCGGCDWQDRPYADQLALKRDRLVAVLAALVPADRIRPCLAASSGDAPWGLRRKVHFAFTEVRGRLRLAHHARGSRDLVAVDECPVHTAAGNAIAFRLCAVLDAAGVRAFPNGPLRHVVVRDVRSGGAPMVTLVVTEDGHPKVRRAVGRWLDGETGRVSVSVNVNDLDTSYIFGRDTRHVAGPARVTERVGATAYQLSPTSFFQTNVDAAELMLGTVLGAVGRPPGRATAVDLYAGVGLFALPLAARGWRVVAVEENPWAIDDGTASLRSNRIVPARCRFVRAPVRRVETWMRHVGPGPIDLLVLDPPRAGVGPKLFGDLLTRLQPRQIVYVSCDPDSLAVDLAALLARRGQGAPGYEVGFAQPVDMFPETAHVEAVVTLARRDAGARPRRAAPRARL